MFPVKKIKIFCCCRITDFQRSGINFSKFQPGDLFRVTDSDVDFRTGFIHTPGAAADGFLASQIRGFILFKLNSRNHIRKPGGQWGNTVVRTRFFDRWYYLRDVRNIWR